MSILNPTTFIEWVVTIFMGVVFSSIACTFAMVILCCSFDVFSAVQSEREYNAQHKKVCPNAYQGAHDIGTNHLMNNQNIPAISHPTALGYEHHEDSREDTTDRFDVPIALLANPVSTGRIHV